MIISWFFIVRLLSVFVVTGGLLFLGLAAEMCREGFQKERNLGIDKTIRCSGRMWERSSKVASMAGFINVIQIYILGGRLVSELFLLDGC